MDREKMNKAISMILKRLAQSDCGDTSCWFAGRGKCGIRTNGGCRCIEKYATAIVDAIEIDEGKVFSCLHPLATLLHNTTHSYMNDKINADECREKQQEHLRCAAYAILRANPIRIKQ